MNARTKTLFHLTKSLDVLTQIMVEGFWPQYSLEDIAWLDIPNKSRLAWPMVSFCDIPILRLRKHTEDYGNYGIGLCREDWSPTGLNPVVAWTKRTTPYTALKCIFGLSVKDTPLNFGCVGRRN